MGVCLCMGPVIVSLSNLAEPSIKDDVVTVLPELYKDGFL